MADLIKTITDKDQFKYIFDKYFAGRDIYLKTSGGSIKLQYLGFSDEHVAFRINRVKNLPENVVVYTRLNANTIYAGLKLYEINEDTFIFIPVKFQILSESRKEDRNSLGAGGGTNVLYITNVMSDFLIERALTMSEKKVDNIEEIARFDLEKQFDRIKIHFINRGKSEIRFKHFETGGDVIFMRDLNTPPVDEEGKGYNHYINEIYSKDLQLSRTHQYISEATVPIMYRKMILYGYLQVNNSRPLTDGQLEVVKRMAIVINELFIKNNVFAVSQKDKFLVSDISSSGIGMVFKDRRAMRYFKQDGMISFETMLPTKKKAIIGAIVRNITFMEGNIIKAGCEIKIMDKASRANFDEFIQEVTSKKKTE